MHAEYNDAMQVLTGVNYNTNDQQKTAVLHARKETLLSLRSLSQPSLWPQYLLQAVSFWFLTWYVWADDDMDADDAFHDCEAIIEKAMATKELDHEKKSYKCISSDMV